MTLGASIKNISTSLNRRLGGSLHTRFPFSHKRIMSGMRRILEQTLTIINLSYFSDNCLVKIKYKSKMALARQAIPLNMISFKDNRDNHLLALTQDMDSNLISIRIALDQLHIL